MATILSFDEVNKLYEQKRGGNMRSMPFGTFFGEMDLSKVQKERRIKTAKDIYPFIVNGISLLYYMVSEGGFDYDAAVREMRDPYNDLMKKLALVHTSFFENHVDNAVAEIINSTLTHQDDLYYFSRDRAAFIAENESSFIWDDADFQTAVDNGLKRKRWSAILDKRTRDTHIKANGQTVPIDQPFVVGNSLLMFPHDGSLGADPSELLNCRCSAIYY